jgi:hypothetical protein
MQYFIKSHKLLRETIKYTFKYNVSTYFYLGSTPKFFIFSETIFVLQRGMLGFIVQTVPYGSRMDRG